MDTRSDIYSLGVLLYELLTGTTPFDRDRLREAGYDEMRRMIREEEPPRPSTRITTLGAAATTVSAHRKTDGARLSQLLRRDLDWIVMKSLEKDRARRYQTASDFARDIERHLSDEPVEARPPRLADRAVKWSRRHRPVVWSAIAGLLMAMIAMATSVSLVLAAYEREKEQRRVAQVSATEAKMERDQAQRERTEAVRQRDAANQNLYLAHMRMAQQDWTAGQTSRLPQILDAHLPVPGAPDHRGWEWYYFLSRCHPELLTLSAHVGGARSVAWSPDGRRVASAGEDRTVKIFDVNRAEEVAVLRGHAGNVWSVAWSPDGRRIASASADTTVKIWDAAAGKEVFSLAGHTRPVRSVAWDPKGERLASASQDLLIKLWDAAKGRELRSLAGHAAYIYWLAWSPDGARIASTGQDGCFRIWEVATGKIVLSRYQPREALYAAAWSPDSQRFAFAGDAGKITVWDVTARRELLTLEGHGGRVTSLSYSPDGHRIVSASRDESVRLWDATTGKTLLTQRGHADVVSAVAWGPDGRRIASASLDGTVKVWDATREPEAITLRGHAGPVSSLAWSPDGQLLASAGADQDKTVKVWDAAQGQVVRTLPQHASGVEAVAWSGDGKHLASTDGNALRIWDAATGKEVRTFRADGPFIALAAAPDGGRFAGRLDFPAKDTRVRIWSLGAGSEDPKGLSPAGYTRAGHSVAFSHDGHRLATSSFHLTVWDAATCHEVLRVWPTANSDRLDGPVAWSPDDRRVAAAWDNDVHLIALAERRETHRLRGHTGTVSCVAWSADGKRIASASKDETVRIWDAVTGQEVVALRNHKGNHRCVAWSPDGRRLATASDDGTLKIWDASPGYELGGDPSHAYEQAQHLAAAGRLDEAIAQFEKLVAAFPTVSTYCRGLAKVHLKKASLCREKHDRHGAIREATTAIQSDPTLAEGFLGRGNLHSSYAWVDASKDHLNQAVADYTEALRLDPINHQVSRKRGGAYVRLGKLDEALADYTQAIRIFPRYEAAYFERGQINRCLGRLDAAIADYTEAIRINTSYFCAYLNRARAWKQKGDFRQAAADYGRLVELDPEDALACNDFAWFLVTCPDRALRNPQRAVQLASKAVRRAAKEGAFRNTLGVAQYRAGNWKEAIEALRKSMELRSGGDAFDWFFLAMAHWRLGHKEEGRTCYDKAVAWTDKNQPRDEELRRFRAEAEELLGVSWKPSAEKEPDRP